MGKVRLRKCRQCGAEFRPMNSMTVACSPSCALELGKKAAEKKVRQKAREQRQWIRKQKERLKSRGDHLKEAQSAFNAFIRERDRDQPCISCGVFSPGGDPRGGVWDCGHYRSVGANPELRFEPLNAHKQCKRCNRDRSGNVVEYRIRLRDRIGDEALEWLEGPHEPKKYTIKDIKQIKAHYRAKVREMRKEAA